jgi:TolB-like protein
MIRTIFATCVVLGFLAAQSRADWSTTQPSIKVAIVPFVVHGDAGHDWLGNAMQEGLATGLHQASGVIVAGTAPADAAGALAMAKYSGADVIIFGSIQIVGDQMRVAGQIISPITGEQVGALRSDGSQRDLFNIEDLLAARVERILAPPTSLNPATTGKPATLQLVGPTIAGGPSRYFDGDLMTQITPPAQYRDEYDKYYYQTSDTSAFAAWCGAPWGVWGGCSGAGYGIGCPVIATPVSGW